MAVGEECFTGVQGAPRPVQRVPGVAAMNVVGGPNREVQVSWAEMASRGLRDALRGAGEVHRLTAAMLSGDEATFAHGLRQMTSNALSYHDVAGEWPERM